MVGNVIVAKKDGMNLPNVLIRTHPRKIGHRKGKF